LGGRIPKGAILLGPPGTGKTLLARAVAGEANVPFFSMSGSDFVEMFVGVGASRVRDLFEQGKKNAPCILFIDEIDAVGRHRGAGLGGGHDEREQTLNQLLVEMDGFESNDGVILLAATNRPDVLDPALLRPGRFDRRVVVDLPDVKGREGILKVHTRKIPLADDVKLVVLARGTPGMSGADLANLVNEAALLSARYGLSKVTMEMMEEAKDKIFLGPERRSRVVKEETKKLTAYHEAGHTIVGAALKYSDPVHKVTIIPRGRAGGLTFFLPEDDRDEVSRDWCLDTITQALGGRVAEELVLHRMGSGAQQDIQMASKLVRKMVMQWGMSEKLGPIAFGEREEQIFLGREIHQHTDYSEKTAQEIDSEVRRIVDDAYQRARKILEERIDVLHAMANALLERETLDSEEVLVLLDGGVPFLVLEVRAVAHAVDLRVDAAMQLDQIFATARLDDGGVDRLVELEVGEAVLPGVGGQHLEMQGADLGDLRVARALGGPLSGQPLQHAEQGEPVAHLIRIGVGDHRAPVGMQLQESLRRQDLHQVRVWCCFNSKIVSEIRGP